MRSAQCAPGIPTGGGGERTADGRLWFPTSRGLAVLNPDARNRDVLPPLVNLVDVVADNRHEVDFSRQVKIPPGNGRVQIRYTGIYLSAPERVRYSYMLEGLDPEWTQSVTRRVINYNSLPQGHYRFVVRAQLPGGPSSERSFAFQLLPHFYQTFWFRCLSVALLLAAGWAVYQLRLQTHPQPFRAGAGGARAPGARDSRYPGARLRGHLLAVGRGGDVHARVSLTRRAPSWIWRGRWRGTASPKPAAP